MPKAYAYVRMSTLSQLEGNSLARQMGACRAFATKHGLTLDEEFELKDLGRSAFTGDNVERGNLRDFMDAIKEGRIEKGSFLLVESLDRLSRQSPINHMTLFLQILNCEINIGTIHPEQIYTKESTTDIHLLFSIFQMSRAHEESLVKSQRVAAAWDNKRARGGIITRRCVAWVTPNLNNTEFDLIDERVQIIGAYMMKPQITERAQMSLHVA
jgi:DNA invertase Pin-like site-specific DNA recombinase